MTEAPRFELVPLRRLRGHEEHEADRVDELMAEIRRAGAFVEPIWVARDTWVILNGHHRVEALRRLGAKRIPAWVFDYESDIIRVERWRGGSPMPKSDVVRRSTQGRPFPPKSTRHRVTVDLPPKSVPLAELLD